MSDITTTSYCNDKKCDNGFSPMLMIILLLCLCNGGGGLFGGGNCQSGSCGLGNGLDGILPIILLLTLGGGCF